MDKRWTVYCHTLISDGRRYIGLTSKTMLARWNGHVNLAKRSNGRRSHFAAAIRKYGKDAFSHEILEVCEDLDVANLAEECWIELLDTRNLEKGFNLAKGGKHVPHPKSNPWDRPGFREKVSGSMKKWFQNPNNSASHSATSREVLSRPEVKKKLSEATSKQFSNPSVRQAMSETVSSLHRDPGVASRFMRGLKNANKDRASKIRCKNGHEFSPENTRTDGNGWRYCRRCAADRASRKSLGARTHCSNGHELSGDNVFLSSDGRRICVACRPTQCSRGHSLADRPPAFRGRGCYRCKLERGRAHGAQTPVVSPV